MSTTSSPKPTILIVDDTLDIRDMLRTMLFDLHCTLLFASSGEEAVSIVASHPPSVVLMDVQMPGMSGLEAMMFIKQQYPATPIIIITGAGSVSIAVRAMQQGAFDYLTKPFTAKVVRETVHRALTNLEQPVEPTTGMTFSADMTADYSIIGTSKPMQEVFKLIGLISTTPNHTSVLITGASGSGKELIARAIHANGNGGVTAAEPFVGINCTAIPENLLESELFGYERGAYTGAMQRRIGKFELAGEGTIFLDEIGDLPMSLQAKLLRVLQERTFERIGSNEPIKIRARFVAATHRNLTDEVRAGRFREDLFYRLNVAVVHAPSLRERPEDIGHLAHFFLSKYNVRMGKTIQGFSDDARRRLEQYSFPGNVRELENLTERAVMLTTGNFILPSAIGISEHQEVSAEATAPMQFPIQSHVFSDAREMVLAEFEQQFVVKLLTIHRGNVSAAADESQMSRQNFHRLMQKYTIEADTFRGT